MYRFAQQQACVDLSSNTGKIRILHFIDVLGAGGAEKVMITLVNALDSKRYHSFVCCFRRGEIDGELELPEDRIRYFAKRMPLDLLLLRCLVRFIRKEKIQILHSHGLQANFYGLLAAKLTNIPSLITVHGKLPTEQRYGKFLFPFVLRHSDRVVYVSNTTRVLCAQRIRMPKNRTYEVIYNGVDLTDNHSLNRSTVRKRLGISPSAFVIGCVGGFRPVKGQKYLVEAARQLLSKRNGFKVVFLGNGPTQPDVKNYAMDLGLARNVAFLGYRQDVNRVLAAVDLFVAPSESEGISIAILEAMALQKPVVATRVGGTPEIVHDGRSGLLVEPGNSTALANAIWKVWQDENLRSRMAVEARRRVEEQFSLQSTVQNYQRIYDGLTY